MKITENNFFDDPELVKYVMRKYGYTKARSQKIVIQLNKLNFTTNSNLTVDQLFETFNRVKA